MTKLRKLHQWDQASIIFTPTTKAVLCYATFITPTTKAVLCYATFITPTTKAVGSNFWIIF